MPEQGSGRRPRRRLGAVLLAALGLGLLTAGLAAGPARADLAAAARALQAEDYERALAELRPAAEAGDKRAQYMLGRMYLTGLGMPADPAAAFDWLSRAAAEPTPDRLALFDLAVLYERGEGVEPDLARAIELYRQAAARGVGAAYLNLGVHYAQGTGVERDLGVALLLFRRAWEAGEPVAADYFGRLAGAGGGDPPVSGRWQAVDYVASADDPALLALAETVGPHIGKTLRLGRRQFSLGGASCRRPTFLAEARPGPALATDSVGATTAFGTLVEAVPPTAVTLEVICEQQLAGTLVVFGDGRLLLPALGGYLVFDRTPSPRVAEAQRLLAERGYDPGPVDGVYGPRTAAALRAFATDAGLPPAGAVSPRLLAALAALVAPRDRDQREDADLPACDPTNPLLLCEP